MGNVLGRPDDRSQEVDLPPKRCRICATKKLGFQAHRISSVVCGTQTSTMQQFGLHRQCLCGRSAVSPPEGVIVDWRYAPLAKFSRPSAVDNRLPSG